MRKLSMFIAEIFSFIMYLTLFGFMAVTWSFEVLQHFFSIKAFVLADIVYCLQGLFIFVIVVLQKNIRQMIREKCQGHVTHQNESELDGE